MPQMAPMPWVFLMLIALGSLSIFISILYFLPSPQLKFMSSKELSKSLSWTW